MSTKCKSNLQKINCSKYFFKFDDADYNFQEHHLISLQTETIMIYFESLVRHGWLGGKFLQKQDRSNRGCRGRKRASEYANCARWGLNQEGRP